MGTKRNIAVEEFLKTPIMPGQSAQIRGLGVQDKSSFGTTADILEVHENPDGTIDITVSEYRNKTIRVKQGDYVRNVAHIGASVIKRPEVRTVSMGFDLSGIISRLNLRATDSQFDTILGKKVQEVNWNPFVINAQGEKEYYQRDFVWTIEDNQHLIESIYNNIDCGKILVRHREWSELEKIINEGGYTEELAFFDIIDGKQRMNAIRGFINDEYPDHLGNYFSDLSLTSQRIFTTTQLMSFSEIDGTVPDSFIIEQFLKLNFMGVPQSKEHIEFVRGINKRL